MIIFLMILHLIAAVIIAAGWKQGRIHTPSALLPVMFLLPLWGPVCAAAYEIHYRGGEKADQEAESSRFGITDEVYRSIRMESGGVEDVLPIEDVLVIGTPRQRRGLLLSVLHSGPEEFVKPLRIAGVNDDTEVVHYAVTALVEIRSQYAKRLSEMEVQLKARPMDPEVLLAYADLDEEYLKSGIPEKNEREELLAHCRKMLEDLFNILNWRRTAANRAQQPYMSNSYQNGRNTRPETKSLPDSETILLRLGEICLLQGDSDSAEKTADWLLGMKPYDEKGIFMKIRAKSIAGDGKGIADLVRQTLESDVYISPEGREMLDFWTTSCGGVPIKSA